MESKRKKTLIQILRGYSFLAPNFIGFAIFTLIPVAFSLILAFSSWDILTPMKFVGLDNFVKLLKDRDFWYYLFNTFFFMLGIPIGMAASLILALALNNKLRGVVIFRTIYFMPSVCSIVAIAIIWRWIYNPDFGLLNSFLRAIGIQNTPNWLSSTIWAKPALMLMGLWQGVGGGGMLLYLAALQGIPQELYEAALIDGANPWQCFWKVTLPMLSFVNFFILVTSIIGGFQTFGQCYVMTGGGPAGSTTTIVYYIYNNAFQWFKMGYASAIAWILFIFMFFATLFQWRFMERRVHYY